MSTRKASPQNTKRPDNGHLIAVNVAKGILSPSSHHAYCFITKDPAKGVKVLFEALPLAWNLYPEGNPDFFHYPKSAFVIDDAHVIREWSATRPVSGDRKVCCIETHSFTDESQNALLKLLESAPRGVFFLVVVPSKELFLPTLFSRLVTSPLETEAEVLVSVGSFLRSSISERGEMMKVMIDSRDRGGAQAFFDLLELKLYEYESKRVKESSGERNFSALLHSLPEIKKLNLDQRSSVKTLLEHVIHFTPRIDIAN